MTLVFIVVLGVSIVGMVSLLLLKHWELTTGHVLGGRARPALGALMHHALVWGEQVLPELLRRWIENSLNLAQMLLHRLTALAVVLVERLLERTLNLLRRKTQVRSGEGQASAFLREVSAHKKQLLKSSRDRAIYEE
jgi:hypothetical protein